MNKFDRATLRMLRPDIEEALKGVGEKHGITFTFNNIRFSDDMFSTRLEARVGENSDDHAKADWDKNCWRFGLKPEDFGKTFSYAGTSYKIVGIKPRSRKFPVIAENLAGKKYKMPVEAIR